MKKLTRICLLVPGLCAWSALATGQDGIVRVHVFGLDSLGGVFSSVVVTRLARIGSYRFVDSENTSTYQLRIASEPISDRAVVYSVALTSNERTSGGRPGYIRSWAGYCPDMIVIEACGAKLVSSIDNEFKDLRKVK